MATTVTRRVFAPGVVNEDAPHRLGRRSEEMGGVSEFRVLLADQPQSGLVDQRGGLKGLAGGFVRHPGSRQLAQLFIHQWQEFVRRLWIALLNGRQDASHVAHTGLGIRFGRGALFRRSRTGAKGGTEQRAVPLFFVFG